MEYCQEVQNCTSETVAVGGKAAARLLAQANGARTGSGADVDAPGAGGVSGPTGGKPKTKPE